MTNPIFSADPSTPQDDSDFPPQSAVDAGILPPKIAPPSEEVIQENQHRAEIYREWINKRVCIKVSHNKLYRADTITGEVIGIDPRPPGYSSGDLLIIRVDAKCRTLVSGIYTYALSEHVTKLPTK